ncbi:hypothetical protein SAMN05660653_01672 [Desulfonatronum thiosulfatophilum]|uniref:DUF1134 domain-containing protein n=1 Tax=Desulfonatronum thiosulfatophilum TaxID=617002 RepID=A0A1G6CS58_9BACT|nr:DUF1134 domain-containing protein [Desulfonatronum thiosulfatophilum]SDB35716.1 hypothetical protein SAMN05660653_01672 [Desulfonatronum thiosulfatophilum]
MNKRCTFYLLALLLPLFLLTFAQADASAQTSSESNTYSKEEIQNAVEGFFAGTTRGLAEILERIFADYGRPQGYIQGEEAGAALVVGLRYGQGFLHLKGMEPVQVYWQGPSVGFDIGVNVAKNFTLVYNLTDPNLIFQRFPGLDGSAYIVGGLSMNYQKSNEIVLAPIRTGMGLRLGASVGYLHYTERKHMNPL